MYPKSKQLIITIFLFLALLIGSASAVNWNIGLGGDTWNGNVTFENTTLVQSTGNIELRQLVDDYVSYWRFDEGSGNIVHDENTQNNNNGTTDSDDFTWVNGTYGKALRFDGNNDYISIPAAASLNNFTEFSIALYINAKNWDALTTGIIGKSAYSANYGFRIYENGSLKLRLGNGNVNPEHDFGSVPLSGQNTHIALSFNGSDIKTYYNGIYQNIIPAQVSSIAGDSAILSIGHVNSSSYFNGVLDEVRLYNRALSQTEINQIKNNEHYVSGTLSSTIKDALSFGFTDYVWKQISFNVTIPINTSVDLYVKTSFDNGSTDPWTDWTLIQANAQSGITYDLPLKNRERYGQWKLELKTNYASLTPEIKNVTFISGELVDKKQGKKITVGPNPFTPTKPPYDKAYFNIDNPSNEPIKLEIYTTKGRLIFEKNFNPSQNIYWDGKNNDGRIAEDGGYIYQLKIGAKSYTGTLILAR